jgi:hypothetical protein
MSDGMALSQERIAVFVTAWFAMLDRNVPAAEAYTYLADTGLLMTFPGSPVTDYASFAQWYNGALTVFFDSIHYVHSIEPAESSGADGQAVVEVEVGWQVAWWSSPDARSKRMSLDSTWQLTLQPSSKNAYGIAIVRYELIGEFRYAPGFPRFPKAR